MDSYDQILDERKNYFENLFSNVPADIAVFNKEHRFEFVNTTSIPDELIRDWVIGKTDEEYLAHKNYPTKIAEKRKKYFEKALKEQITVEFEEAIYEGNGKITYFLRRYFPIKENGDFAEKIISYGFDITDIKTTQIDLLERSSMFSRMINNLNFCVIVIDDSLTIKFANKKWGEFFGIISNQLTDYFKKDKTGIKNLFSIKLKEKYNDSLKPINLLMISERGNQLNLECSFVPFYSINNEQKNWMLCFTDVTDHVNAVEGLKKIIIKEKNLTELKNNFVEMVSHELRNPLSIILSNIDLIEQKIDQIGWEKSEPFKKYTQRITNQIDIITTLLNDVLVVEKIESHKIISKPERIFPVENFTQLVKELYSPWKDGRTLDLSFKGDNQMLYFDKSHLKYIVTNLVDNAFKYSKDKPQPKLRVNIRTNSWSILIADNGIGIPKNNISKLFNAFFRGSNVGDIEGTGVGLMTVKYFMELNHGTLLLRSTVGKGTVFCLSFNIHQVASNI
jgi:signal transduction histidine kinase/PAS domain-containing protein